MSPRRVTLPLLSVLVTLLLAAAAWGDSHARIVRLSYIEGDVQIDRADGKGFQPAFLNLPITQGVRLETRNDGRAEIEFEDGSTLRLVPDSSLSFDQLGLRDSGAKFTSVTLGQGAAYFDLRKKGSDEFTITAGHGARFELEHNARFRVNADATETKLAVFDGEVKFDGADKSVMVKKNETVQTDATGQFSIAKNIAPDPSDSWSKERDEYRKQYAANSAHVLSSSYSYGSADLSYYGNFFNSPYGYLWRPWSAPAAWDPFVDGAWVFYPGFGYSWVSAHPWGWLPYHYGSWIYYQPYGWCWQPGRVWNNWSPVAIVHPPHPGFVPPHPPATPPAGGGVIAVGRGPNRGIPHNPRLQPPDDLNIRTRGFEAQGPRSSSVERSQGLVRWPGPTIKLPNGTETGNAARDQALGTRGLSSVRHPNAGSPQLVAPLVPSTLAPLRPTGPSSSSTIHWPAPVATQPRSAPLNSPPLPAPHMMSPAPHIANVPHITSVPSIRTGAPHPSRR